MKLWICALFATITSLCFQGCMVSASCGTDPKCVNNSSYHFSWCTPKISCDRSEPNITCTHREFSFTQKTLYAWLDEEINITCYPATLNVLGEDSNQTSRMIRFTKNYHNKSLSCNGKPGTTITSPVTVFILMQPATDVTRQTFPSHGGPVTMKLNFEANTEFVTKDNITIKHKDSTITKFFYGNNGLKHEILLYFKEVTAQNEGEYEISILAANSQCQFSKLTIVGVLGKALHMGWIVSIGLGSLSFVLIVAVIVCAVSRFRNRNKDDRSKIEMETTRSAVDSIPVNGLRRQVSNPQIPTPRAPVTAPPTVSQFPQANLSYNRYSEDEFESDSDDEASRTATLDDRPPMPLPKESFGSNPPRSPAPHGHMNGATNFPFATKEKNFPMASRDLPPPPLGRPPVSPGHRSLPPPPTPQTNFAFRGGTRY